MVKHKRVININDLNGSQLKLAQGILEQQGNSYDKIVNVSMTVQEKKPFDFAGFIDSVIIIGCLVGIVWTLFNY